MSQSYIISRCSWVLPRLFLQLKSFWTVNSSAEGLKVQDYQKLCLRTNFTQSNSQNSFKSHMCKQCGWLTVRWYCVKLFSYQGSESDKLAKARIACYIVLLVVCSKSCWNKLAFQRCISLTCLIFFSRGDKTLPQFYHRNILQKILGKFLLLS